MDAFYQLLTGPVLWISFAVLIGGLVVRINFFYHRDRDRRGQYFQPAGRGWIRRALAYWCFPPGGVTWEQSPVLTALVTLFRLFLIAVPVFILSHNFLWEHIFGWRLPTLSDGWAAALTLAVIVCALFLYVRRLAISDIKKPSVVRDHLPLLLIVAAFVTGFLARYQIGGAYRLTMILHILLGEFLMIVIPFTKLRISVPGAAVHE